MIDELRAVTFPHISEEPGHEAVGSDQNWIFLSTLQNLLEGASLIQERSGIDLPSAANHTDASRVDGEVEHARRNARAMLSHHVVASAIVKQAQA